MNIAEYIIDRIQKDNIDTVFGYIGGNITYVVDAIERNDNVKYVQTYNEQGASFAANAYAQVAGKYGVAISSSGPGAINMIIGIANAYYDSIPCLYVTGNVNTNTMKNDSGVRQNGFQETDIVSLVKSITKYAVSINGNDDIEAIVEKALKIMRSNRPGPVLIDLPHNIQRMEITPKSEGFDDSRHTQNRNIEELVSLYLKELSNCIKPVVLVGGGCRGFHEKRAVFQFVKKYKIPVVSSLLGKDVIDNSSDTYCGMIGGYGHNSANEILNESDLVLVLGSRLDERQRVISKDKFLMNAKVFQVDIDKEELINVVKKNQIYAKVDDFLKCLNAFHCHRRFDEWCNFSKEKYTYEFRNRKDFVFSKTNVDEFRRIIGEARDTVICADVGNNQMFTAQTVEILDGAMLLNSGGLGSMGYAIPAAIGAAYACNKEIICAVGDGGLMMNLQELQVIKRDKLDIKIIVLNNKSLGMIENYQKVAFDERYLGSKKGYLAPEIDRLANMFNMPFYKNYDVEKSVKDLNCASIIEMEI